MVCIFYNTIMTYGTLYIVATPIGNREDITIRALSTLFLVDFILCEDTRKTGSLLDYYRKSERYNSMIQTVEPKKAKFISYYNEVEDIKLPEIIRLLQEGNNIALVSDAGTPLISDPGFPLIRECIKLEIPIIPIPGVSSVTTALSVSGLPIDKFLFLGYLPKKEGKRKELLANINSIIRIIKVTIVLFEAPHRLQTTLTDMQEILGDIQIVIARELTKIHEEIWRGKVSDALEHFKNSKGEFVILLNI